MARWNVTDRERLLAKIEKHESGCWLWTGSLRGTKTHRYGCIRYRGKSEGAHRASYMEFNGEIPPGLNVLHRCDVPRCVNPEHLFVGTDSENMQDMTSKGRHPYRLGETHPNSKLTDDQVRMIRESKQSHGQLAAAFGVTRATIKNVRNGRTHTHIKLGEKFADPHTFRTPRGEGHKRSKLTWDAVRDIRSSGESARAMAAKYGVTDVTIYYVRTGKGWKESAP